MLGTGKNGPRGRLLTDRRPTAAGSARSIASERERESMAGVCMVGLQLQHSAVDVMPARPRSQSDMQRHSNPSAVDGEVSKVPPVAGVMRRRACGRRFFPVAIARGPASQTRSWAQKRTRLARVASTGWK